MVEQFEFENENFDTLVKTVNESVKIDEDLMKSIHKIIYLLEGLEFKYNKLRLLLDIENSESKRIKELEEQVALLISVIFPSNKGIINDLNLLNLRNSFMPVTIFLIVMRCP